MTDNLILLHPAQESPVTVLGVYQFVKDKLPNLKIVPKKEQSVTELQITSQNTTVRGSTIIRYLARRVPEAKLYGSSLDDAFATSEVDQWVDYAREHLGDVKAALAVPCSDLNNFLQLRTLLAGYHITIADLAIWGALKQNTNWSNFFNSAEKDFPHLVRWFKYLEATPQLSALNGKETSKDSTSSSNATGSQGNFLKLDLPNAKEGAVVTRFPPEPSGFLHIGHAKAATLNNYYATYFKGRIIIRFDDTNPSKEKVEYIENILKDLETLNIRSTDGKVTYTSDYFPDLLKIAEQLIKEGKAYVDTTSKDEIKDQRGKGIESKCRNQSVEENLRLWNEMIQGTEEGIKCVLRAKIDMQEANKVLRDPALARCNDTPHHRTGTKYKVYPLYDFACPIVDSIEGVTHALRSSEYHDRNPLYYWVVDAAKLRRPFIQDFSRLNFGFTLLSKRKLQWFVDKGYVSGWDDPRFPTIQGLLRRGLTVEALTQFILAQGPSKNLNLMEIEKLWAVNRAIIDPIVPRYTAIDNSKKVILTLSNGPATPTYKSILRHKKNPSLGEKIVTFTNKIYIEGADAALIKDGEEVTLMDWGNAIIEKVHKTGENVVSLEGRLHLEGSVKSTEKKLTWLPTIEDLIKTSLIEYGHLITKKKLEDEDLLEDFVNHNSKTEIDAIGDANLRSLKKGDRLQLERRGYFIVEEPYLNSQKPMVLIMIPDGHTTKAASILTTKPKEETNDKNKKKETK